MRPEKLYLTDIVEAADHIALFITGFNREKFLDDELHKSAVVKKIEVIGEAIKNIPEDLRNQYPEVNWSGFARMRDRTAHGYFGINYNIVWETATQEIPILREQIVLILEQEFK